MRHGLGVAMEGGMCASVEAIVSCLTRASSSFFCNKIAALGNRIMAAVQ